MRVAEAARVELDDRGRALAVLAQRPLQRAAGAAVAPQDVALAAGEEGLAPGTAALQAVKRSIA